MPLRVNAFAVLFSINCRTSSSIDEVLDKPLVVITASMVFDKFEIAPDTSIPSFVIILSKLGLISNPTPCVFNF